MFFGRVVRVLFPDRCVGCRVSGTLLCAVCMQDLKPNTLPLASYVTSVFSHKDLRVRTLIHLLKYRNTRHVADVFALPLAEALMEILGETELLRGAGRVVLVPIPLSRKRYKKRGYNQSTLLAHALCTYIPTLTVVPYLLQKTTETIPQASMKHRRDRMHNLCNCFAVVKKVAHTVPSVTTIVLIDDVTTTGATLDRAYDALREAGYYKIYALTISH